MNASPITQYTLPLVKSYESEDSYQELHKFNFPVTRLKQHPSANEYGYGYIADFDSVGPVAETQPQENPYITLPSLSKLSNFEMTDSSPVQIWEGRVIQINPEEELMEVLLHDKIGQTPPHTGEIDLQWVSPQDQDILQPGAVFYLTLSKRWKRGGIENVQELRFRRLPCWTKQQLAQIESEAEMLLSKMKATKIAE